MDWGSSNLGKLRPGKLKSTASIVTRLRIKLHVSSAHTQPQPGMEVNGKLSHSICVDKVVYAIRGVYISRYLKIVEIRTTPVQGNL